MTHQSTKLHHLAKRTGLVFLFVFATAILGGCGGADKEAASMPGQIQAGVFTFDIPAGWQTLSGGEERSARREIVASTEQMIKQYSGDSDADYGPLGVDEFKSIRMPGNVGWLIAYTMRIPPEQNYLQTMETQQAEKIDWGKGQGIVRRVIENKRTQIGDAEVIWLDMEMRGEARNLSIYYWAKEDPGLVGTIIVTVDPGEYENIKTDLDGILGSLQIHAGK